MFKNLINKNCANIQKNFSLMKFSNHKNPFKYLSAPIKIAPDESKLPPPTKIDKGTIEYLEKVSLVGFENDKAIKVVEEAIRFADQIFEVNTNDVVPMISILENECLTLREDITKVGVTRSDLLSHSKITVENYYVTPLECFQEESSQESSDLNKMTNTNF